MEHTWEAGTILDIEVLLPDIPEVVGRITSNNTTNERLVLMDQFAEGLVRQVWIDNKREPADRVFMFEVPVLVSVKRRT